MTREHQDSINQGTSRLEEVELIISKILRIGVLLAAVVIIVGLVQYLVTGESGYPKDTYPMGFTAIWNGLLAWKSVAVMEVGLLLLIFTPVLRVLVSLFAFVVEKDYRFVAITSLVLVILLISFILGEVE